MSTTAAQESLATEAAHLKNLLALPTRTALKITLMTAIERAAYLNQHSLTISRHNATVYMGMNTKQVWEQGDVAEAALLDTYFHDDLAALMDRKEVAP